MAGRESNGGSVVIVAIPAKNQSVWDISTEKIPHLTLLHLGEHPVAVGIVDELVSTFHEFYLPVKRRGTLGDKSADVLFFDPTAWQREYIEKIRCRILTNPIIKDSYYSVQQFPKWVPHLTLGYPDAPAKTDNTSHLSVLASVVFDRIALWTDNYKGVEFPLRTWNDELRMSERGAAFLEHYGIKGMRWGVSRSDSGVTTGQSMKKDARKTGFKAAVKVANKVYGPSTDAKSASKAQLKAAVGGVRTMSNAEMRQVINRMALEKQYRELYGEHQLHDAGVSAAKRYAKRGAKWVGGFLRDVGTDAASSWLKRPGSNASGRTSRRAWETGQQFGNVINGTVVQKAIGS